MTYHLTVGACSYCDYLGCVAGIEKARATGVHVCEFETASEAIRALDKLTPTFQPGTLALRPGPCPEGEAARVRISEPHLKATTRTQGPPLLDERNTALIAFEGERVAYAFAALDGRRESRGWVRVRVREGAWVHEFTTRREQASPGWPVQRETRFAFIRRL